MSALKDVNVTYVAVVYEDTDFGRDGVQRLRELGKEKGVCVDAEIKMTVGRVAYNRQLIETP